MNARYPRDGGLAGDAGLIDGLLGATAILGRARAAVERIAGAAPDGPVLPGDEPFLDLLLGAVALFSALERELVSCAPELPAPPAASAGAAAPRDLLR